ncbi:nitrous oxide reductase family maturation protein NosD [Amaricoccus sp.]|uniref:nitrous oxide reductase family maturation protein NosD n=1 Tax=Amaricoccus sp. TaxID=1872485 RepID=UPI001B6D473F|nr:nitrous oxide reductase family maturation protein NosD [Amaricoccus sp.]MBP7242842.1 nitrous oxide reductase family maturation protein NosD [Amaricoccus sp.]
MTPLVPLLLVLLLPGLAAAATRTLAPGDDLAQAVAAAAPGDEIVLGAGIYAGPVALDRPLTLRGEPGAVLDGGGEGSVVTVTAADVTIRGLTIRGSGSDRAAMDAGIVIEKGVSNTLVEGNTLIDNLHGVRLQGSRGTTARGNDITGRTGRQADAGNGFMIWNAPDALIEGNHVRFGRDGIFTRVSKKDIFRGNRFEKTRFAIHYMYTNDSVIEDNVSVDNTVGYAIMFSDRLRIVGNVSEGDRDHGLLLNSSNRSEISGNRVTGRALPASRWLTFSQGADGDDDGMAAAPASEAPEVHANRDRIGPEKCLFIYSANNNAIEDNRFEGCAIGIHFTAGAEGNAVAGNAFIGNQTQVKYVGTRTLDWSRDGRGNYWSDNAAFDLDGDGIADAAYRPNDIIDRVMWTAPQARLLVTSPAVQVIRWAQSRFPATLPGGVVDTAPLMAPPEVAR